MISSNTFGRHRAPKTLLTTTKRFGAVIAALAVLLAMFVTTGPLATQSAAANGTILGDSATDLVKHSDTAGVEVGTRFSVLADGTATGMSFWKGKDTAKSHNGSLWSSSGTKLASATFTNESSSGWQTAEFDRPVPLEAGKAYVVSYFAPSGGYAATHNYTGKSQSADLKIGAGAGVFKYGGTSQFPTKSFRNSSYWVDVVFTRVAAPATPAPTEPTPVPEPAPGPESAPEPESVPQPAPQPEPTPAPTTPPSEFPTAATTGVPSGTTLSTYTGPCTITAAGTVIDAKKVECAPLRVEAAGVKITRSVIDGTVSTSEQGTGSFTISDSEVVIGERMGTGIGDARFTATRVEVTGGNRSVNCYIDCTIEDSYVHGQFTDLAGIAHESGVRMGSGSVIRGNTIACDARMTAPGSGCSAALTGYGDFAVVKNNTIDGNLFIAGSGGYCTYGGSTPNKPFSVGTRDIRFTNNVWERGSSGKCGAYGPITSFDTKAPGNVWSNNTWDDGTAVRAG